MGRPKQDPPPPVITSQRAGRLYRLLCLTASAPRTRAALERRLRVDTRGFYRDLEMLRTLGIDVAFADDRYRLTGELDDALTRLPFPDPGLSLREALTLARGNTDAHRKLKKRIDTFLGPSAVGDGRV